MFDIVIPAKAGIQCLFHKRRWGPGFEGTTKLMEPSMKFARCFTAFGMAMLWALLAVEQAAGQGAGQRYPSKPVHVIVPFTAGSATDILARTFGQKLSEMWGQPVVVENRAGAGGTIGAAVGAKSAPDGYTLLVHSAAHAYNPSIHTSLPFDTAKDFVGVVPLAGHPHPLA